MVPIAPLSLAAVYHSSRFEHSHRAIQKPVEEP